MLKFSIRDTVSFFGKHQSHRICAKNAQMLFQCEKKGKAFFPYFFLLLFSFFLVESHWFKYRFCRLTRWWWWWWAKTSWKHSRTIACESIDVIDKKSQSIVNIFRISPFWKCSYCNYMGLSTKKEKTAKTNVTQSVFATFLWVVSFFSCSFLRFVNVCSNVKDP